MKAQTHTALTHAMLRNARPLAIDGAYLEDCSGGVRLIMLTGDHIDWWKCYESEKAAIEAAGNRVNPGGGK